MARRVPTWWLALVVRESRQHGGNDGYDDTAESAYEWDSTVPNHAKLRIGDRIVIWDKHSLVGASVIEGIAVTTARKQVHRCPRCGLSGIKARSQLSPRYKCYKCKSVFEVPTSYEIDVDRYRSSHGDRWADLHNMLAGRELRRACVSPKSQLSLRPLDELRFKELLAGAGRTVLF